MSRRTILLGLCAVATSIALLPTGSALAGGTSDIPEVRVKIRSVTLDHYTGNIEVRTRVKCEQAVAGVGTGRWRASAFQDARAAGSADITCDGVGRRAKIILDPRVGRFHPGAADITIDSLAFGSTSGTFESTSFTTEL